MIGIAGRVRAALKWTVAEAMYWSGALSLIARSRLRGKAIVLTYHRVLRSEDMPRTWSNPGMVVSAATFERHLRLIQRFFQPVSIDEFARHLDDGRKFRRPACLVTFDDGWRDTFEIAWPLLQRYRVPAIVFLPVGRLGMKHGFWQEQVGEGLHRLWHAAQSNPELARRLADLLRSENFSDLTAVPAGRIRLEIRGLVDSLKARGEGAAERLIDFLRNLNAVESTLDTLMDWPQVRQMAAAGVAFGGHGVTHRRLTQIAFPDAEAEIRESVSALQRALGVTVMAFSYPNGDWSPALADVVRDAGCQLSFSTARGIVDADERFALRRINMHEDAAWSGPLFLARTAGIF
jgi:peptidoglycan/xylan/chitin deacetylase (PgdA/CDA1 family)